MWVAESGEHDVELVQASMSRLATDVLTAAIATISSTAPWICTAYFAMHGNRLWFTSQESTRHVSEIRQHPRVAVAIWQVPTKWGEKLFGVQLAGTAREVEAVADASIGINALHAKYPGTLATLPTPDAVIGEARSTCLFCIQFDDGSLRDEANITKGRFAIRWTT